MANNFKRTEETFDPGSLTLPQKHYVSPETFAEEKEKIFNRFWFCVGHVSRIPSPGDYYLQEVFGESFIILRDKTGEVHVHYNVCSHRGTQICETLPSGAESKNLGRSTLQCRYHGWTYALDGKLMGAGSMMRMPGFSPADYPLTGAPVYIWEGFIFVSLVSNPEPFEVLYKPMMGRLADWKVAGLKPHIRDTRLVAANWKLIMLNFNECDHCATIHPALMKHIDNKSAENDLSHGPFLGGLMKITGGESLTETGRMCGLPLGGQLTLRTVRMGYYYSILGNLLLNIHPDYLMFHYLTPVSATETIIESVWLFNSESFARPDFRPMEAVDVWRKTNSEDWEICELAQKGISSRAYKPGPYSPKESLLVAFDKEYIHLMNK